MRRMGHLEPSILQSVICKRAEAFRRQGRRGIDFSPIIRYNFYYME